MRTGLTPIKKVPAILFQEAYITIKPLDTSFGFEKFREKVYWRNSRGKISNAMYRRSVLQQGQSRIKNVFL